MLRLCKLLHLRTAHFRPALTQAGRWVTAVRGDGKGWPDLTIVGPGGLLFRELKAGESPTPEQRAWAVALAEAGQDVAIWRPRDLSTGRIKAELEAIRRPRRDATVAHPLANGPQAGTGYHEE